MKKTMDQLIMAMFVAMIASLVLFVICSQFEGLWSTAMIFLVFSVVLWGADLMACLASLFGEFF